MTKVIVLGEETLKKELKPIEFHFALNGDKTMSKAYDKPTYYKYIELVCKNYSRDFDLMFAYDNPDRRDSGVLYLGKFNDGVVE